MIAAWTLAGGRLFEPAPFCLVGIVNVTPDSFYDGGRYVRPEAAVARGAQLLDQGAGMLDLGAESTRPGARPLGATLAEACATEADRLFPALSGLRKERPESILCVDTCHAETARRALELGADVINDVSAWERDPALLEVLAAYRPGYVLMHGGDRGGTEPRGQGPVVDRVLRFFEQRLDRLIRAGLPEDCVVLDPGIGFGKTHQESLELFRRIEALHAFGRPLYVGVSMKSLFGELLGLSLAQRGEATALVVALLAERGVAYHRVHDVASSAVALAVAGWFGAGQEGVVRAVAGNTLTGRAAAEQR